MPWTQGRKITNLLEFESGLVVDQDLVRDLPDTHPERELIAPELGPREFSFLREWKRNVLVYERDPLGHFWIQAKNSSSKLL